MTIGQHTGFEFIELQNIGNSILEDDDEDDEEEIIIEFAIQSRRGQKGWNLAS